MSTPPHEPLVKLAEIPGRGRALIATRTINPGEIILTDSPLLLYPTSIPSSSSFCSHCFRYLLHSSPSPISCPSSCSSLFCSPLCLSSHPLLLCQTLRRLLPSLPSADPDLLSQSLFLISAHALSLSSPSEFNRLLSLYGGTNNEPISPFLPSFFPTDLTAALLSRDKFNSFGLMEPFREGGERKVRAYGIYPLACFFNHDCLPNACRFDYVDRRDGGRNTDIVVRAIHEIPEGREVCLSYFPVNWEYKERQRRLMEDYGFCCECDRCLVERNWKEEEDEEEGEEMVEEVDGGDEGMEGVEDETGDDFPHAYFFVRYLCDRENCGGTLAPLPPSPQGTLSDVMECNVCGRLRKEEDVDKDGDMIDDE